MCPGKTKGSDDGPRGIPVFRMKESWTTALMLGACTAAMAEEIGMTPDGNGEFIGQPAG
jgi:hypothetical protein